MMARYDACRCVAPLQDLRQLQSAAVVRTHEGLPPHESAPNSTSGISITLLFSCPLPLSNVAPPLPVEVPHQGCP
jgi:hypothetical protein